MENKKSAMLITAHPDDEVLFFSSVLRTYKEKLYPVLVTDANADKKGQERLAEYHKVLERFGIKDYALLKCPDEYGPNLEKETIQGELEQIYENIGRPSEIFTHGPFGEYGHPHHIQISHLVHEAFFDKAKKIYHPNILEIENDDTQTYDFSWKEKLEIMTSVYKKEYGRFVTLLPIRAKESFLLSHKEVTLISEFLLDSNKKAPPESALKSYRSYLKSLELFAEQGSLERPF